jgi:hypothetical protein
MPTTSHGEYQDRIVARLKRLFRVSLVAEACVKSDHVRRAADRAAAQHDPVPQWAVDGVLTSPDALVPILESLELRHGTAG